MPMNASTLEIAALTATLPAHVILILGGGAAALVLLIYIGVALPAVWSGKPADARQQPPYSPRSWTHAPVPTGARRRAKARRGGDGSRVSSPQPNALARWLHCLMCGCRSFGKLEHVGAPCCGYSPRTCPLRGNGGVTCSIDHWWLWSTKSLGNNRRLTHDYLCSWDA